MANDKREPILIIGAGIGGLAAALGAVRAGRQVLVFEQGDQSSAVDRGLVLFPKGRRALEVLGLPRSRLAAGRELRSGVVASFRGGKPWASTRRERRSQSALLVAREDLRRVLHEELARAARRDVIVPRRRLIALEQRNGEVAALFASGDSAVGSALIGADGVHSRVRRSLFGDLPLQFVGRTTFCALVHDPALEPSVGDYVEHHGPGLRFVQCALGGGRSAWCASVLGKVPVTTRARAFLLACLTGWPEELRRLVAATPEDAVCRSAVCDLPPLARWCAGRVALLGDAAHPMTPDLEQGASQTIEDAAALCQELAMGADIESSLGRYQARRLTRAAAVVRASRWFGHVSSLSGQLGFRVRELGFRLSPAALGIRGVLSLAQAHADDAGWRLFPQPPAPATSPEM